MMKAMGLRLCCALFFTVLPYAADAQGSDDVPLPALKVGDGWVFDEVDEKGASGFSQRRLDYIIDRLDGETMMVGVKPDGAPIGYEDHLVGADWSQRRMVDGRNTVTTRPFEFPMAAGHKWTVDFIDPTRRGNQVSAHIHRTYSVVGWEDVTVPAGHFRAIKVVADGVDEAQIEVPAVASANVAAAPGGSTSVAHSQRGGVGKLVRGTHAEIYYVPAVKNFVRMVEEQYNTDNVRVMRHTLNLVGFKPAV
jgi:hypothetical protein